jgi:hypothetical protein
VSDDDFLAVEGNDCPMSSCRPGRLPVPDRQGQGPRDSHAETQSEVDFVTVGSDANILA